MPAVSKSQQALFGLAKAVKKGKISPSKVGKSVKDIAKGMSTKEIDKFAKTKTTDLPKKKTAPKKEVKKESIEQLRSIIRETVKRILKESK